MRQRRGYGSESEEEQDEDEDDEEEDSLDGMARKSEEGEDGGVDEEDADEEQGWDDAELPLSLPLSPPLTSGEQQQDAGEEGGGGRRSEVFEQLRRDARTAREWGAGAWHQNNMAAAVRVCRRLACTVLDTVG